MKKIIKENKYLILVIITILILNVLFDKSTKKNNLQNQLFTLTFPSIYLLSK